jgi:hypothetical protein
MGTGRFVPSPLWLPSYIFYELVKSAELGLNALNGTESKGCILRG